MSTSPPRGSPSNALLMFSYLLLTLCGLTLPLSPPLSLSQGSFRCHVPRTVSPECRKLSQFVTADVQCQK